MAEEASEELGQHAKKMPVWTKCDWIEQQDVKNQVQAAFRINLKSFLERSKRPYDYRFLNISGGSGAGKTRTGEEVPQMLGPNAGFPAEVPAKAVHILFNPVQSPLAKEYPEGYGPN